MTQKHKDFLKELFDKCIYQRKQWILSRTKPEAVSYVLEKVLEERVKELKHALLVPYELVKKEGIK